MVDDEAGTGGGGLFHIPNLCIIDGDALAVGEFAVCSRHGSGVGEVLGGRVVHAVAEKYHMASGGASIRLSVLTGQAWVFWWLVTAGKDK